jgi:hypothetical protein
LNSDKQVASANLGGMRARDWIRNWGLAALWAVQPLISGPAFGDSLDARADAFRTAATIGLWGLWALVLLATLVPRTFTLTLIRVAIPASVVAAGWATLAAAEPGWQHGLALASTLAAAVASLAPTTGERFVNGSAYGAERRFPLRAPGLVMLGLVEAVWMAVVAGAVAGPLLLASEQWAAGAAATVVGWPLAVAGTRSLHRLAQRWLVFVPAGLALVDPLTLADAISMPARTLVSIQPALADTTAHDLTAGALGLAVHAAFTELLTIAPLVSSDDGSALVEVNAILFTPTRPGAVLREALDRGLPLG